MAAAQLLRKELPNLRVRVVNVTDLLILQPDSFHPHRLTPEAFDDLFTADKPLLFNFHGYPVAVKQLLFDRPAFPRFLINGYIEEGTTTTPFDLCVQNLASRYQCSDAGCACCRRIQRGGRGAGGRHLFAL
jgi:xylulose-5-phosphate/fructose-6-phosphate phosphoketolase